MIKNFLFFFGTGILTPLYYGRMVESGHLALILSLIAIATAVSSLYLGKLSDKVGVQKLFYISVPISVISVLFLNFLIAQIAYGILIAIIGLLINIHTSNQEGASGVKFGKLTFYIQLAFALSLFAGGILNTLIATTAYIVLMVLFLILDPIIQKFKKRSAEKAKNTTPPFIVVK